MLEAKLVLDVVQYSRDMRKSREEMLEMASATEKTSSALDGMVGKATSAAAALVGIGSAAGSLGIGVKLAADFEQAEIAFATMLGSANNAKILMEDIKEFAAQTPFEIPGLVQATKSLIAFGVGQGDVLDTLRRIGDISSGIGAPVKEIAELYGKAKIQGRLFQEDINQLTGRGIPIIQELAKQFRVSESAIKGMVEKGQVNFGHLEVAFRSLTDEGGKFHGLMQVQSQSIGGLFSTMKDSVSGVLREMGQSFLAAADGARLLKAATSFIDSMTTGFRILGAIIGGIVGVVSNVIETFMGWASEIAILGAGIKIFLITLALLKDAFIALVLVYLAWKAVSLVNHWIGLAAAMSKVASVIWTLVRSKQALVAIQIAWLAVSGPGGWKILAGAAVVAAGAMYGIKKMMDAVKTSGEGLRGTMENVGGTMFDAAGYAQYRKTVADLERQLNSGKINRQEFNVGKTTAEKEYLKSKDALNGVAKAVEKTSALTKNYTDLITFLYGPQERHHDQLQAFQTLLKKGTIDQEKFNKAKEKLDKQLRSELPGTALIDNLKEQAATFGMTANQVALYKAQIAGATKDELKLAESQRKVVAALERTTKAFEKMDAAASSIGDNVMSPLAKFKKDLAEIEKLALNDLLTEDEAALAAAGKLKDLAGSLSERASPGALRRGSAEAFSAVNQASKQNPINRVAEILARAERMQKQELEEAKKIKKAIEGLNIKEADPNG